MVPRKLRSARIAKGWTQGALADAAGLTSRTVWNIEHGGCPRMSTRRKLFKALEIDFSAVSHVDWFGPLPTQGGG